MRHSQLPTLIKSFAFFGFIVLIASFLYWNRCDSTKPKNSQIPWRAERLLSWSDFKGPVPENPSAAAKSITWIDLNVAEGDLGQTKYIVTTYFDTDSYYISDLADSNLLKHEQGHFNITEAGARELRAYIDLIKSSDVAELLIKSELDSVNFRVAKIHSTYDLETGHGMLKEKQVFWNFKIDSMLRK